MIIVNAEKHDFPKFCQNPKWSVSEQQGAEWRTFWRDSHPNRWKAESYRSPQRPRIKHSSLRCRHLSQRLLQVLHQRLCLQAHTRSQKVGSGGEPAAHPGGCSYFQSDFESCTDHCVIIVGNLASSMTKKSSLKAFKKKAFPSVCHFFHWSFPLLWLFFCRCFKKWCQSGIVMFLLSLLG